MPAEQVAEITEGEVRLAFGRDEFERLEEHREAPPSEEIRADTTDL